MADDNEDMGSTFLKNHFSEGQDPPNNATVMGVGMRRGQQNPVTADPRLLQKAPGGPALYDPGPNQALKNRRDTGMGRMGTDEYYENKDKRKGISST